MTPTFVNRDGIEDFISPHTINEIFVSGVARFQLRLRSRTHFKFHVCLDAASNSASAEVLRNLTARLQDILAQKRMDNVTFEIVVVDDLPLNRVTRKFQLIVDETRAVEPLEGETARAQLALVTSA
jgi:hypothetical protein